jgi:hypothetical protein
MQQTCHSTRLRISPLRSLTEVTELKIIIDYLGRHRPARWQAVESNVENFPSIMGDLMGLIALNRDISTY